MLDRSDKAAKAVIISGDKGAYANPAGRARQQVELALETGRLPDTAGGDLYKMALAAKFLAETEGLRDDYIVAANDALHDMVAARFGNGEIGAGEADARASMADIHAEAGKACEAAQLAYDHAKARRTYYESENVPWPEWSGYYDKQPRIILSLSAGEGLLSGIVIVGSAEVNGGLEVVLPFLALTTMVNLKLAAFIGRGSFRWRRARWSKKLKLSVSMGLGTLCLVAQNGLLGYWRTGLDISLSSLVKLLLNFHDHLGAFTVTGLGLLLAATIAHQTGVQLHRGFTPEYKRLRVEEARLGAALAAERAYWREQLDDAFDDGVAAIDEALEAARDAHSEVAAARRRTVEDRLRLRREVFARAREIAFCIAEYNQRVIAAWPCADDVPAHYREPAEMVGTVLRSLRRERAAASAIRREAHMNAENLQAAEERGAAAKAALASERDRIIGVIRGA